MISWGLGGFKIMSGLLQRPILSGYHGDEYKMIKRVTLRVVVKPEEMTMCWSWAPPTNYELVLGVSFHVGWLPTKF